ncbi:MAG TPA: hypothetical protein PLD17_04230 [Flavobacteriales bacterium]|nr:hypothetical protein [Flavobacteriales bacterium]HQX28859.1 hypothetical protein [Flavobacteriales bacterium]HQX37642.1 hypothetical protein [Flavobacteriales bacterium]HQZ92103.1 hypothetical protein [Flavobacteriales bacterium]
MRYAKSKCSGTTQLARRSLVLTTHSIPLVEINSVMTNAFDRVH